MADWIWEESIRVDIENLVVAAREKCVYRAIFFVNDAIFFLDLMPECYPYFVSGATRVLRCAGADVVDKWSADRRADAGSIRFGNFKARDAFLAKANNFTPIWDQLTTKGAKCTN